MERFRFPFSPVLLFYKVRQTVEMFSKSRKAAKGLNMSRVPSIFYFLILGMLFLPGAVSASFVFSPRIRQAQELVFRLHFSEASLLLAAEEKEAPENVLVSAMRCKQYFLLAFVDEQEASYKLFKKEAAAFHDRLENEPAAETDRFAGFLESEVLLFQVVLHAKYKEYVAGAWDLHHCYRTIKENKSRFPTFAPNDLIHGAVSTMLGAVPSEYEWLLQMVGLDGDIETGRQEVVRFLRGLPGSEYECYTDETLFALCSIYNSILSDRPADPLMIRGLEARYPLNDLVRYAYTGLLMKQGNNERTLKMLAAPDDPKAGGVFQQLKFRRGQSWLQKLDHRAETDFLQFATSFRGTSFVKAAWQKVAWNRWLNGDVKGYHQAMDRCKLSGSTFLDEDKDAQREAGDGIPPNRPLLKARLLCDGGYYAEALKVIQGVPSDSFPTMKDKLEFTYRYARIMQHTGREDQAIAFYEKTLRNGASTTYYFSASSALLLGQLYESKGDKVKARSYYKQCLALRNHDYQNGIDQKAKAGLRRVGSR